MLIYCKDRLVPVETNMIVLKAKDDDGYFYVHRSLYDQAVILDHLYHEVPGEITKMIATDGVEDRADIALFRSKAPDPISILGCFLLMVKDELDNIEDCTGAIHVISSYLNFLKLLKVSPELRADVPRFSLSVKEEYSIAWDRFFKQTVPYGASEVVYASSPIATKARPVAAVEDDEDESVDIEDLETESAINEDGSINEDVMQANLQALNNMSGSFLSQYDFDDDEDVDDEDEEETTSSSSPSSGGSGGGGGNNDSQSYVVSQAEQVDDDKPDLTGLDALEDI